MPVNNRVGRGGQTPGITPRDRDYMQQALVLARRAAEEGEVPVGAVLIRDFAVIGEGWNRPIGTCDPTGHAEIVALRAAAETAGNYRLPGTTLYVTIEPCAMCVGALVHARIDRLVYGAREPRAGAVESRFQLLQQEAYNHRIGVVGGVLEKECGAIVRAFFQSRR